MKKTAIGMISVLLILALLPVSVFAEEAVSEDRVVSAEISESFSSEVMNGLYLPDVTAEMSSASYWSAKVAEPDKVLADPLTISAINEKILNDPATNMYDLKNWPYETYNGISQNELNMSSSLDNAQYAFDVGARFDWEGNRYSTFEEAREYIYDPMIANSQDPAATEEMPVRYGICTSRTCLQILPTDHPLWDDYSDPDFGYLWSSTVRVNEPLIIKSTSADGLYYLAISSNDSGWIPAADVAICADKEEWLAAWDLPSEKTLVVYADKILTEESYYAPETANRLLTMGTCLELADEADWEGLIINRRAYNNHVVWLPVRNEDGSYKKVLALIGENRMVSEGFLPLTTANLLTVMMNQLGDTYGWGGMLLSNDCSGYVRDVYKCFGLELARNTSWQPKQPVYKIDLSAIDSSVPDPDTTGMTEEEKAAALAAAQQERDEKKAECIKQLPPGTALYFRGHAMLYLGEDNGKLYVISSVSDLRPDSDSSVLRVRGGLINTLDVQRGNRTTWLQNLHTAVVPYREEIHPGWNVIDGDLYYYNEDLSLHTGWLQEGDLWYYMDPSTGKMTTGWQKVGDNWYYLDPETGIMQTGWLLQGDTWYYLKNSGAMAVGWQMVGSQWYFFKQGGAMASSEWCGGYWLSANGTWTYQAKGSWRQNNKGWWFGDTYGWYAKNETVKIDGTEYAFDAAGYWVR